MSGARETVLAAARMGVEADTAEEGYAEIRALTATGFSDAELADAVAGAVHDGVLGDPVCLPPGRLQCCWKLSIK